MAKLQFLHAQVFGFDGWCSYGVEGEKGRLLFVSLSRVKVQQKVWQCSGFACTSGSVLTAGRKSRFLMEKSCFCTQRWAAVNSLKGCKVARRGCERW